VTAALAATPATPVTEAVRRLRTLVSPYTGLVAAVGDLAVATDDARLHRVGCRTADLSQLTGVAADYRPGGAGARREDAIAAALGEAAERYSACFVPEHELRLATAEELGRAAIRPERFALFSEEQYGRPGFPFRPFTAATRVRWVRGFDLPTGRDAWLPVQLVYLAWSRPCDFGEEPIGYSTSNGTACGCTLEEALVRGLLETLERDAFMVTWYASLSLPRLDWRRHPELAAHDRRYFRPTGLRYSAIDLSCFFDVPTVAGVVRDELAEGAALGVGAACAPSVEEAWKRALAEAFAVHAWVRALARDRETAPAGPNDVTTFDHHVAFYGTRERAGLTRFLDDGSDRRDVREVGPVPGSRPKEVLEALTERLAARGASAYAVDVTASDVRAAGLRVAKVLAPELAPLDVAYEGRFLGGRRLTHAAFELGLLPAPLGPDRLNPWPHPFP
jgi:ribosomal protein S12 methylthiotransferase accessory factor